mmetsp:Transcript_74954/g.162106  ORF Transcript_74954/g.162106 Transcript_74954/m.162106 type:complete len:385 (-) Transcript_74954:456-1610(-)
MMGELCPLVDDSDGPCRVDVHHAHQGRDAVEGGVLVCFQHRLRNSAAAFLLILLEDVRLLSPPTWRLVIDLEELRCDLLGDVLLLNLLEAAQHPCVLVVHGLSVQVEPGASLSVGGVLDEGNGMLYHLRIHRSLLHSAHPMIRRRVLVARGGGREALEGEVELELMDVEGLHHLGDAVTHVLLVVEPELGQVSVVLVQRLRLLDHVVRAHVAVGNPHHLGPEELAGVVGRRLLLLAPAVHQVDQFVLQLEGGTGGRLRAIVDRCRIPVLEVLDALQDSGVYLQAFSLHHYMAILLLCPANGTHAVIWQVPSREVGVAVALRKMEIVKLRLVWRRDTQVKAAEEADLAVLKGVEELLVAVVLPARPCLDRCADLPVAAHLGWANL